MIEHCSFLTEDGATADDDVIAMLGRKGVTVVSTLGRLPGLAVKPRMEVLMPQIVEVFRRIREAGVTLVCASDSGIIPAKPHDVLPWAAEMFVNTNGATPLQALRAMTSIAARACRVHDRKGRVAPGYDADLLAVQGNPFGTSLALARPACAPARRPRPLR
jgi:imidazolonepropionase-like amidohydrolase